MKYKISWKVPQDKWLTVAKMFGSMTRKERDDAGPGVKLIGRWHDVVAHEGVAIVESKDFAAVTRFVGLWTPYINMSIAPVMDDNGAAAFCRQTTADHKT